MKPRIIFFFMLLALVTVVQAQNSTLQAFVDQIEDRGLSRVLYWSNTSNSAAGQIAVNFGRPTWKPEYEEPKNFDTMTQGKTWRMGKDFWTVLSTDLPITIAGKEIPAGAYYLGVSRSADGVSWSLVFIDPGTIRNQRIDASEIEKATALFNVPLTFKTTTTAQERLHISLTNAKEKLQEVTLRIAWGKFELEAVVMVKITG